MRASLLLLSLAVGASALEPQDLHGTWKGTLEEDPTSLVEVYYAPDGSTEMRLKSNFLGVAEFKAQIGGAWSVKGDTVLVRITGGWSQLAEEEPEPIEAETAPEGNKTTLVPGNPKKLLMEDCEDGVCGTEELTYVGASRTFTLPTVGDGLSIRAAKAKVGSFRGRHGRLVMRVLRDGQAFDLIGRPAR